jgi:hypothetical protein
MCRWQNMATTLEQPRLDHDNLAMHRGGPKRLRCQGEGHSAMGEIGV